MHNTARPLICPCLSVSVEDMYGGRPIEVPLTTKCVRQ